MPLLFSPDAFDGIPEHEAKLLMRKSEWLWDHRKEVTHFPLKANLNPYYKREIGDYRILYTYDIDTDEMVICLVGHRKNIYKRASGR